MPFSLHNREQVLQTRLCPTESVRILGQRGVSAQRWPIRNGVLEERRAQRPQVAERDPLDGLSS
jgi:hypothetical protein